jgi:hypothetical protein
MVCQKVRKADPNLWSKIQLAGRSSQLSHRPAAERESTYVFAMVNSVAGNFTRLKLRRRKKAEKALERRE